MLKSVLAKPVYGLYDDPTYMGMALLRLNEMGNNAIQGMNENSTRLSSMMGIRAAQSNPVEAAAIGALTRSGSAGDAQGIGLAGALAAILANLAHVTPK